MVIEKVAFCFPFTNQNVSHSSDLSKTYHPKISQTHRSRSAICYRSCQSALPLASPRPSSILLILGQRSSPNSLRDPTDNKFHYSSTFHRRSACGLSKPFYRCQNFQRSPVNIYQLTIGEANKKSVLQKQNLHTSLRRRETDRARRRKLHNLLLSKFLTAAQW